MKQIYERKDTYVISFSLDETTHEYRFDNIPDAVKYAGAISDLYNVIVRIYIETGDIVKIGA